MLTKDTILPEVGKIWWENNNVMMDFIHHHLSREGAAIFTVEHCAFAEHFPRWFGNIVGNCSVFEARKYMIENMSVEEVRDPMINEGHHESLVKFGVALGLKKDAILKHEPMIPMQMALHYWDNISRTKPWIEAFAGIGGLELNLHRDLAKRYGEKPLVSVELWEPLDLPREALTHWVAADAADPDEAGHGEETLKILCQYAKTPEQQANVLATLKQSLSVFRYVYDQIGRAAIDATSKASRTKK